MGVIEDTVDRIKVYANKTGSTTDKLVRGCVEGVISKINAEMSNYVLASRDNTVAVAANATTVTMPERCLKIIELGRYDSGSDRIAPRYEEISEAEFNRDFGLQTSLTAIPPDHVNKWFFVDDTSAGLRQIRLVWPPDTAFTMSVRYYEKLQSDNIQRLEDPDILFHGAVARLAKWFGNETFYHNQLYMQALDTMRAARRSLDRTAQEHVNPQIEQHNIIGASLVD